MRMDGWMTEGGWRMFMFEISKISKISMWWSGLKLPDSPVCGLSDCRMNFLPYPIAHSW